MKTSPNLPISQNEQLTVLPHNELEKAYDYVSRFNKHGIALARDDSGYFHIGRDGKPLFAERYKRLTVPSDIDQTARASSDGKLWFHIGMDGKPLYENQFDDTWYFRANGIARVRLHDKWFHIGRDGIPLYEDRFDDVRDFDVLGYARARLNGDVFYIGMDGKFKFRPEPKEFYDDDNE